MGYGFRDNHPKYIYYMYGFIKLERFNAGTSVPTLNRNDVHMHKIAIPNKKKNKKNRPNPFYLGQSYRIKRKTNRRKERAKKRINAETSNKRNKITWI